MSEENAENQERNGPQTKTAITRLGEWKPLFLQALARCGVIGSACTVAQVSRDTVSRHRESDEKFAAAYRDALRDAADLVDREIFRRAVEGVEKPVVFQGKVQKDQVVREYSDVLLIHLSKAMKPKKYRERSENVNRNENHNYGPEDMPESLALPNLMRERAKARGVDLN